MKHTRNWSLIRILDCPRRPLFNASNLFPGGRRNESKETAAFNWSSFLRATGQISFGHVARASLDIMRLKMSSVPRSKNDGINSGTSKEEVISDYLYIIIMDNVIYVNLTCRFTYQFHMSSNPLERAIRVPNGGGEFWTEGEGVFFRFLQSVAKPDSRYVAWYLPDVKCPGVSDAV